ncbi:ADP-ribosylglycohydrolase family protein [Fimbriimonas ginsengisoli]|uniref:Large exoproteins involved in heme utilization or adhesion n=1 Tax=Fimbriimonas ginsengisoli Gsoil 348 TaxID=661478 RepID=A0A068NYB0_FIMGI|nr:ADP-ribosylglycohydrolase family protein [Fimbriimonas ginsengisoli]AIE86809.1 Large exoproteins involved in heme utilization or adhesion [Fimbriimonas ginsengisoli Gsoil 348]
MSKKPFPPLPRDYAERVYAGVLGKIIGVYLGRPFEQWGHDAIVAKFGEIDHYVHEKMGVPLVVTDDDISGTFTFLRSLTDYGLDPELTPAQIGESWLNYIVENRTILWWGGMGNSTEHTAFLRLKSGITAPESGCIALNGKTVAEQIGAQIFIDGWGMICPGEPDRAADFACRAASVSHDGEAIYGAQMVAAMEAMAFVEADINRVIEAGLDLIPHHSVLTRMIGDVREWHAQGLDWRAGFRKIEAEYGYGKFGGGCHMVPNHALIIHSLLHGKGDFDLSLKIVNTCGYDTDCNSGNVGCILGIRNGLDGIAPKWRDPVADKMYLPTADGGRGVTDAATEALRIANVRRVMAGESALRPNEGSRFHFCLSGSLQGFTRSDGKPIQNVSGLLRIETGSETVRVGTPTFMPPETRKAGGYSVVASPTLYPGQIIRADISAGSKDSIEVGLFISVYDEHDRLKVLRGDKVRLEPKDRTELSWTAPDVDGYPIAEVGIEASGGRAYLDSLTWDGIPDVRLRKTAAGTAWRDSWVNGVSEFATWGEPFRLIQNEGTGLLIHGCREWDGYKVTSRITLHLVERAGIAAHVQGMRRWVALVLCRDGFVRLVKSLDGERVLAEAPFSWAFDEEHEFSLRVDGDRYAGSIDGRVVVEAIDDERPLREGAVGFFVTEGRIGAQEMRVGHRR